MTLTKVKTFALAAFVADRASMDTVGTGVQIDWTKFTDPEYGAPGKRVIRAGTAIEPTGEPGAPALLCGPAKGAGSGNAFLTKQHIEEDDNAAALSGHGAYSAGVVYETLLPDASGAPRKLSDLLKAQLSRFTFLPYEDRR